MSVTFPHWQYMPSLGVHSVTTSKYPPNNNDIRSRDDMLSPMQSNTLHHSINRAVLSTMYEHMRKRVGELGEWGVVIYIYMYDNGKKMKVWRNVSTSVMRLTKTRNVGDWW